MNKLTLPGWSFKKFVDGKWPYVLLCAHMIFLYVRPQEIITPIRPLKLAGILGLLLLLWVIANFKKWSFSNRYMTMLLLLIVSFGISSIGAVNVIGYRRTILWATAYLPVVLGIIYLVCTEDRYKHFMTLWCVIHFLFALIVFKNGGWGPGDFIYDENDAALGLGIGLPYLFYISRWRGITKKRRRLFLMGAGLVLCAIIFTQSRGGLLGLVALLGIMWLYSKYKIRIVLTLVILSTVGGGVVYSLLPEGYFEDVQSGLTDSEDSTRVERLRSWEIAWIMYQNNFLFGVGPGNFPWYVGEYQKMTSWWEDGLTSLEGRQVHSMYFEMLADLGTVGMLLYFSLVIGVTRKAHQYQRQIMMQPECPDTLYNLALVCRAIVVAAFCWFISGAFISVSYYPHIPIWLAIAIITFRHIDVTQMQLTEASSNHAS